MNKAKIKQLAAEQANAAKTKQTAAQRPQDTSEHAGRTSGAPTDGAGKEAFQAQLYVALIGGSNFAQTMAGRAVVCREAWKISKTAVEVWLEEKAKSEGRA